MRVSGELEETGGTGGFRGTGRTTAEEQIEPGELGELASCGGIG